MRSKLKLLIFLLVATLMLLPSIGLAQSNEDVLKTKLGLIWNNRISLSTASQHIFISVSDGKSRAIVVHGSGKSKSEAWKAAADSAANAVRDKQLAPVWVKADFVTDEEVVSFSRLSKLMTKALFPYFFRQGIAFDKDYGTALLEQEVNCNSILNYTDKNIDLIRLNEYLLNSGRQGLTKLPSELTLFKCKAVVCDENNSVFEIEDSNANYGRRSVIANKDQAQYVIAKASDFMRRLVQPGGKFIYGYYPINDEVLEGYNIVRHEGTIWSLVLSYEITKDEKLIPIIEGAINHLVSTSIVYKEDKAYVVGKNEISMGGNGLGVVSLTEYMRVFKTDKYMDLVRKLANGILGQINPKTGQLTQVLIYPGYKVKHVFLSEFYDGEAALGLAKFYGLSNEEKYLDGARLLAKYFIDNEYEKFSSHWMAYSFNELTKHDSNPAYYEFAIRNINGHLLKARDTALDNHTYFEFLMASYEQMARKKKLDISTAGVVNEKLFAQALIKKANQHLNAFMYPEQAMYLKAPDKIIGAFAMRSDAFRIRIDDVQHFVGGYCMYYYSYEDIAKLAR